jgi:hypothetical protein
MSSFYVHYTNGNDATDCGLITSPCKTFSYAVNSGTEQSKVILLYDSNNHTLTGASFTTPSRKYSVSGIPESVDGVLTYPTISYSYSTWELIYFSSSSSEGNFSNLTFAINGENSTPNKYFLLQEADLNGYIRFQFET